MAVRAWLRAAGVLPPRRRIRRLIGGLAASRATLREAVDGVPTALRGERPEEGVWSVAEVLEHLALVEASFERIFRGLTAGAPRRARPASRYDHDDNAPDLDGMGRIVDRSRKVETIDAVRPTGTLAWDAAWRELERSRRAVVRAVRTAGDLDLAGVTHPHFLLGPLDGYQWIAFLGGHEARHAAQVREIGRRVMATSTSTSTSTSRGGGDFGSCSVAPRAASFRATLPAPGSP